jgi:hypothetical protein
MFLISSVLDAKQNEDYRNVQMSVLIGSSQFFDHPGNP